MRRHRNSNTNEPAVQQQTVCRPAPSHRRTIRSVEGRKQGIAFTCALKDFSRTRGTQTEALVCQMAGATASPVRSKARKESTLRVYISRAVKGCNSPGRIMKRSKIGNQNCGCHYTDHHEGMKNVDRTIFP